MKRTILSIKAILFSAIALSGLSACEAQTNNKSESNSESSAIHWTSFEEAVAKSQQTPKKMFIDVYTGWCGWCKKMDASTFTDPEVAKYINDNFYPVKFNAETQDTIHFMDKSFKYLPEYKTNELAISLLAGKLGYPSYVFLDESFTLMGGAVQGYQAKNDMMAYLTYFNASLHKQQDFESYRQEYFKKNPGQ